MLAAARRQVQKGRRGCCRWLSRACGRWLWCLYHYYLDWGCLQLSLIRATWDSGPLPWHLKNGMTKRLPIVDASTAACHLEHKQVIDPEEAGLVCHFLGA